MRTSIIKNNYLNYVLLVLRIPNVIEIATKEKYMFNYISIHVKCKTIKKYT